MPEMSSSADSETVGTAAEFFAGIGLVRMALERAGWSVSYANDIKVFKRDMYRENFSGGHFDLRDVREVRGSDIPSVELATASFPCMDLSLAGRRRGLDGDHSSLFWEFSRVLDEMGPRRPKFVLVENVPSFVSSKGGRDLRAVVSHLNNLGYECDLLITDAKWYVPQSRKRLFIVGLPIGVDRDSVWLHPSPLRPQALTRFIRDNTDLQFISLPSTPPPTAETSLESVVERLSGSDGRWWNPDRVALFSASLSKRNHDRLILMESSPVSVWATAYRRTRAGRSMWEIRSDDIAGCLRTSSGGSSKQALVEAGGGEFRVRWMTPIEYARLQGAGEYKVPESVSANQALFGFGDAVCVPAMEWIIREFLNPMIMPTATVAADSRA